MARKRLPYAPIDAKGRPLRIGDVVRLVRRPPLHRMPTETKSAFRQALSRKFRISQFERYGHAELYVHRFETIYVEPWLLRRVQRGPRQEALGGPRLLVSRRAPNPKVHAATARRSVPKR
jgi:hypothetical protein